MSPLPNETFNPYSTSPIPFLTLERIDVVRWRVAPENVCDCSRICEDRVRRGRIFRWNHWLGTCVAWYFSPQLFCTGPIEFVVLSVSIFLGSFLGAFGLYCILVDKALKSVLITEENSPGCYGRAPVLALTWFTYFQCYYFRGTDMYALAPRTICILCATIDSGLDK